MPPCVGADFPPSPYDLVGCPRCGTGHADVGDLYQRGLPHRRCISPLPMVRSRAVCPSWRAGIIAFALKLAYTIGGSFVFDGIPVANAGVIDLATGPAGPTETWRLNE